MQAGNFGGAFDQVFLWIVLWNFTEDASRRILYYGAKKSKMTKNSNQADPAVRPAGSDPEVVRQKILFLKVSVSLGGFGPSVAHGNQILRDDVLFKLRKTRQKPALSLTPLGAVRAAAEGTGYKNRRLGKSRGVRFDSRLV